MRTTFDVIDILYGYLKPLNPNLTGGVYKISRPADSKSEDIVINSLPIDNEDVQRATTNINIHVPDINVKINNQNQTQPNFPRLKELANKVIPIVENVFSNADYNIYMDQQHILQDQEGAANHYVNIRVKFKSHKSYFFN